MKNLNRTGSLFLIVILCSLSLTNCELDDVQDIRQGIIQAWAEQLIAPGFENFADESLVLKEASIAFCESIDTETLQTAQNAWRQTRLAYKRTEVFAFGAHKEFPHRYGPAIDTWPAREEDILQLLNDTVELSTEKITNGGATKRGLPVLEWFLFAHPETLIADTIDEPRRCEMLVAVSDDLSISAQGLATRWSLDTGSFLRTLTEPEAAQGMYADTKESFTELVNRMWFIMENIQRDKLGRPLGNESNGNPQPENSESRFSSNALLDIEQNLLMVADLFEATDTRQGLISHPRMAQRQDLIDSFRAQIIKTQESLTDIPPPLLTAVIDEPQLVQAAIDDFNVLQTLIQVDFLNTLALNVTFNDADGD